MECRIHLDRKIKTVLGRTWNEKHLRGIGPDIGSVASRAILRISIKFPHSGTQCLCLVVQSFADM